jgi:hypothetical protein
MRYRAKSTRGWPKGGQNSKETKKQMKSGFPGLIIGLSNPTRRHEWSGLEGIIRGKFQHPVK